jgi:hypothetical protein
VILTRAKSGLAALSLALLAACASPGVQVAAPVPAAPVEVAPSAKSVALSEYYAALQYQMRLRGLIRGAEDSAAVPFSANALAQNFEAIALYDEYRPGQTGFRHSQTPSTLRRWAQPVRMSVEFGDTVPSATRAADRAFITKYATRLSAASGHPIRMDSQNPNFLVLVVGEDDRPAFANRLRQFVPGISENTVDSFLDLPRSILCLVYAFPGSRDNGAYDRAIAVIRAEHPGLLRQSCIHEELAQGLGLANDSPRARPSIFNDDEEFGFLTRHDELLLKMLYDPRLSVGMRAEQARPIITTLAYELAG